MDVNSIDDESKRQLFRTERVVVALLFIAWGIIILFPSVVLDYLGTISIEHNRGIFDWLLPKYSPQSILFVAVPVLSFIALVLTEILINIKMLKKRDKITRNKILNISLSAKVFIHFALLYGIVYIWFIYNI